MSGKRTSLKLTEFEDIEFLARLEDLADEDGYTSTQVLADGLNLDVEYPARNVGSRLSWMRRYGVVEKDPERAQFWRLTLVGSELVHGKLTRSQRTMIQRVGPDGTLAMIRAVSQRIVTDRRDEAIHLASRQWRYGLAERKRLR